MKRLWRNYNLSIVLATLFLVSWVAQFGTGWVSYAQEQREHGQPAELAGYMWRFADNTFENWQSEFLQLLTFVILTAYLIHRGSHESKDNDEEVMARLKRIEAAVQKLQRETTRV
jgi:hypothetical protein